MTFDSIRKVRYCWISLDILALCDPFFEPQRSQTNVIDCQLTSCKTRLLKLGIHRKPLKTVGSKISLGGLLTGSQGSSHRRISYDSRESTSTYIRQNAPSSWGQGFSPNTRVFTLVISGLNS